MFSDGVGRKFILISYCQTVLFMLLWFDKIPADDFRFLTLMLIGGYIGGNLGNKAITQQGKSSDKVV